MRRLFLYTLMGYLSGCVIGNERFTRPADLSPAWLVDRTRVLGVQASPPEIRPGETATFEALVASPSTEDPFSIIWLACPAEGGGIGFGCALDLADVDLSTVTPEELADLGFIGFEPLLPPAYTAPDDLLAGLTPVERSEGDYVLVQVTAIPPDADLDAANLDFTDIEAAYKRLVVSEASTPNRNPAPGAFTVEEQVIADDVTVHLDPDQPYELGLVLPPSSIETYEYLRSDGSIELREEEPYVAWFSTGGELLEEVTLHPNTQADWISPRSGTEGTWYAVVRDRRGGQSWHVQRWIVD